MFNIFLPTKIIFGQGSVEHLPDSIKNLGNKAMIVTGKKSTKQSGLLDRIVSLLKKTDVESVIYDKIQPNPVSNDVDEAAEIAKKENVKFVIGLGGGSAIDSAKAIALTAAMGGKFWDYVEVGGGKKPDKALPVIAIPTTHGTGTEADPFAVITNPETNEKVGIGYSVIFPKISIVDPEIMITLPKNQTAYTSLDAFYHSLEAFLNIDANPYSDILAIDSMKRIVANLPIAYRNGADIYARTNLAWASTEAGITETLTGVIANHAIEHGLSGFHPELPHGLGLCITGPYLLEYIFDEIRERLAILAHEVFNIDEYNTTTAARIFIDMLFEFQELFSLNQKLSSLGFKEKELENIAKVAYRAMKGVVVKTPKKLQENDLLQIIKKAF
ncbi:MULTISPECIES: iron-containing alcohol dehydrogenase [Pseudothermotoga]|jgi:alcohol dehydrogenase|uniref:Iron-containing alcohol dehydrogenase n=1 Tax=Pseudothermotoga lettingae (strain ATCC BAA-301 / DSM 14385 / NBRC 107922 / TMO) TaxID=416591 RepID=A8F3L6_PSELT|nr:MULTISPECIES: iron-containing alcohol dehydrogenase [Pseudothermotoga]ABV32750.1 iron-containing alcohol dehydrogenase [Pseudothermotoga lettingae TMO]MDI3495608.1 alcohol dehydrogenase [Pseudothermotoga sp.]MDK2885242.1 alcohol dehydrogenase [Pseudothermotoga sp.]GLI48256.1 alcohol dehydrogenase [Pseudothermotoga lettingae TMO]